MRTTVNFRGEDRTVEFTVVDEPDVNYYAVEWHFPDLTIEQHDALAVTEQEESDICTACCDAASDDDPYDYD
ncbi:hypothetical protein [Microvirga zambiensis]|uniref:hypothetical protein n=1 Tax=Microvirga zambiensis TaxID=1402137 RepID=UPI00191E6EF4|nr:hypothetical protein [Microvirga zambiensis]